MNHPPLKASDKPEGPIYGHPATPMEREANLRALARLHQLFPRLPRRDIADFLINCTAWPLAPLTYCIHNQAARLSQEAHKDVGRAWRIANKWVNLHRITRADRRAFLLRSKGVSVSEE